VLRLKGLEKHLVIGLADVLENAAVKTKVARGSRKKAAKKKFPA